jgi:hypothetical protein
MEPTIRQFGCLTFSFVPRCYRTAHVVSSTSDKTSYCDVTGNNRHLPIDTTDSFRLALLEADPDAIPNVKNTAMQHKFYHSWCFRKHTVPWSGKHFWSRHTSLLKYYLWSNGGTVNSGLVGSDAVWTLLIFRRNTPPPPSVLKVACNTLFICTYCVCTFSK